MGDPIVQTAALCDVDGCEELARYVQTGDGRAVRDPKKRCDEHHPDVGLWRDLAWAIAREFHREDVRELHGAGETDG